MFNFRKKIIGGKRTFSNIPKTYLSTKTKEIESANKIDESLYAKYNVKRGLRNANGTGVLVGLTNIGAVKGYDVNDEKKKIPIEGRLYYRGYEIKDLVRNYIEEDRFGFEEVTYLLIFGSFPTTVHFK